MSTETVQIINQTVQLNKLVDFNNIFVQKQDSNVNWDNVEYFKFQQTT